MQLPGMMALALCLSTAMALPPCARSAEPSRPASNASLLARALAGPQARVEEIVFAVRAASPGHWYENFAYGVKKERYKYAKAGGRLCRLNLRTNNMTSIVDDPKGSVRDPHVHYDGKRVLFSYRKGGTHHYHLYEVNVDGTRLRQLTDGPWDDIEPIYMPADDIIFVSSRCKSYVPCWYTQVAILYRCGPKGENVRPISANMEHENTPAMLPDGRVLYTRWEYIDRNNVAFHHLWTVNPDGTGPMTFFGNLRPGDVYIDAKPIPDAGGVVLICSPGHGRSEHQGAVAIVDPCAGPDDMASMRLVTARKEACYRDPYPVASDLFLVARDDQLLLMDAEGRAEVIHNLKQEGKRLWVHEPQLLRPRRREPVLADRSDPREATGRFVLTDVTRGRNMKGVQRGEIKKLLVLEPLPKPVSFNGWMGPVSFKRTYFLERILGVVPVEADGSAYFEAPAGRPMLFVALDKDDLAVKRMRSFASVMPGEVTGCVGCHEHRSQTNPPQQSPPIALSRPPSCITPIKGAPDILDFPRDVQPILDRHCVRCHNYDESPPADLPLIGDRGQWFSHSYYALTYHGYGSDETHRRGGNDSPHTSGSYASQLIDTIDGDHYGVALSPRERTIIRLWIDCNSPYAGTYAALGTGVVPLRVSQKTLKRRCTGCHRTAKPQTYKTTRSGMPGFKESYGFDMWGLIAEANEYEKVMRRLPLLGDSAAGAERLYNLTVPEKSPVLLAPLAEEAGGWGTCKRILPANDSAASAGASPAERAAQSHVVAVFASRSDPDYQAILADIRFTKTALERRKRFDMPGFRPNAHYIREMKRYGVLPAAFDPATDPINVYETDEAYFQSFWVRSP